MCCCVRFESCQLVFDLGGLLDCLPWNCRQRSHRYWRLCLQ